MPARTLNLYCDESCHLPSDGERHMVLGALAVPTDCRHEVSSAIREIKTKHGLRSHRELKWTKVSRSKLEMYLEIVGYFFGDDRLAFRAVVASKEGLQHERFGQTHDQWYYKMYYQLLASMIAPGDLTSVYIDIKDTRSGPKVAELQRILGVSRQDCLERIQIVRSDEVEAIQLADILVGAVMFANRGSGESDAKRRVIQGIEEHRGKALTLPSVSAVVDTKFNLFFWRGQS